MVLASGAWAGDWSEAAPTGGWLVAERRVVLITGSAKD